MLENEHDDSGRLGQFPQPGELWSLWDMLELLVEDYTGHQRNLRVLELRIADYVEKQNRNPTVELLSLEERFLSSVYMFAGQCESMGLRLTAIPLRDFLRYVEERNGCSINDGEGTLNMGWSPAKMYLGLLRDARRRFRDETQNLLFLVVDPSKAALYAQPEPLFGVNVAKKFPSLTSEISEAGKCLALGRSTASAFHSIRAMEGGIRAMSRCLGIPDPTKGSDRSWFKMLEKIESGFKAKWPTSGDRMTGDGQTFEELHGALAGMQNPYRNATAHLDQDYNDDEAKHIMELCRGLLVRIAKRMDENGHPVV